MHSENEGARGQAAPRQLSGRGLCVLDRRHGGADPLRHARLSAGRARREDRRAGPGFGKNGIVDLKQDFDQTIDLVTAPVGLHSTPIVAKDVVIVGAAHRDRRQPEEQEPTSRATSAASTSRTGKRLWIFHTIPRPGEFGNDTWLNGLVVVHRQHRRLGADLGRRTAGPRLPAGRAADARLLRRPSSRRRTCSAKASSPSICGPASGSGTTSWCTTACGTWTSRARRFSRDITVNGTDRQGAGAADQAGVPVRLQSRDRRADLADRRAARAEGRYARRVVLADAAASDQAAARTIGQGLTDRRPDRLHAGAARRSRKARRALPARPDVHAAFGQQDRRADCDVDDGGAGGGDQLAGRVVRSRRRTRSSSHRRRPSRRWVLCRRRRVGPGPAVPPGHRAVRRAPHGRVGCRCRRDSHTRAAAPSGRRRSGWRRRRRWLAVSAGPADHEATVQPHYRHRFRQRRLPLAGAVWSDARRDPESSGAEGTEPAADGLGKVSTPARS